MRPLTDSKTCLNILSTRENPISTKEIIGKESYCSSFGNASIMGSTSTASLPARMARKRHGKRKK